MFERQNCDRKLFFFGSLILFLQLFLFCDIIIEGSLFVVVFNSVSKVRFLLFSNSLLVTYLSLALYVNFFFKVFVKKCVIVSKQIVVNSLFILVDNVSFVIFFLVVCFVRWFIYFRSNLFVFVGKLFFFMFIFLFRYQTGFFVILTFLLIIDIVFRCFFLFFGNSICFVSFVNNLFSVKVLIDKEYFLILVELRLSFLSKVLAFLKLFSWT